MFGFQSSGRVAIAILFLVPIGFACLAGCGPSEPATNNDGGSTDFVETQIPDEPADSPSTPDDRFTEPAEATDSEWTASASSPEDQTMEPVVAQSESGDGSPLSKTEDAHPALTEIPEPVETPDATETSEPTDAAGPAEIPPSTEGGDGEPSLDELLAKLEVPPPWLDSVETSYDTSQPWKEGRLEIRRLLSLGKPETHREAIKLTWIYLQKDDIGDGHEYPMYTFLGGEPVWSIRAHEEFVKKPHEHAPIHSYLSLAALYTQYEEFERAKTILDKCMSDLPAPPWQTMRKAEVLAAFGDLYATWGKIDEAKDNYAQAAALYPTAKPPYGGHLLPRRAEAVQSKLDLLTFRSLATATLRDGRYEDRALGYAGDIHVTLSIKSGRIADIQLRHEEKIDQNACVTVPEQILERQSLQVDSISGATVTKDAIVDGVYQALKKAGLE